MTVQAPPTISAAEWIERLCQDDEGLAPLPPVAVVAAHPDDEAIGLGSRLPRLRNASFIHITDGSPADGHDAAQHGFTARHDYAAARRQELLDALALAGIDSRQTHCLNVVDQETSFRLASISRQLADRLAELKPEAVITQPYEGGHPDHDATAFCVHTACRLLARSGQSAPILLEMTAYHLGPNGIEPFTFLPADAIKSTTVHLNPSQQAFKRRLLDCFPTQQQTLAYFPAEVERFRPAPDYDFARPPCAGMLFYEMHPWGMTGARFCELARRALQELRFSEPA